MFVRICQSSLTTLLFLRCFEAGTSPPAYALRSVHSDAMKSVLAGRAMRSSAEMKRSVKDAEFVVRRGSGTPCSGPAEAYALGIQDHAPPTHLRLSPCT